MPCASPLVCVPASHPSTSPPWYRCGMFPVAIACGNTFILKPSERDPSTSLRLAELMSEAGLPDGVLNVINGDKEAVDVLLTDPRIAAVSFVGSTAVGSYIYTTGCAHGKRVQALCGAKKPHGRVARCRHGSSRRCSDGGGVWLCRRTLHGGFGRRTGRRRHRRRIGATLGTPRAGDSKSVPIRTPMPKWARS